MKPSEIKGFGEIRSPFFGWLKMDASYGTKPVSQAAMDASLLLLP